MEPGNRGDTMGGEARVTSFLNIDLDIRGDAGDVANFLKSLDASVVVLGCTGQEVTLELAKDHPTLEETLTGLVEFVRALQPESRDIWDRLDFRRLNVGIQAASEPHAAVFALSAKAVEMSAALRFEILFTVYAERETRFGQSN